MEKIQVWDKTCINRCSTRMITADSVQALVTGVHTPRICETKVKEIIELRVKGYVEGKYEVSSIECKNNLFDAVLHFVGDEMEIQLDLAPEPKPRRRYPTPVKFIPTDGAPPEDNEEEVIDIMDATSYENALLGRLVYTFCCPKCEGRCVVLKTNEVDACSFCQTKFRVVSS